MPFSPQNTLVGVYLCVNFAEVFAICEQKTWIMSPSTCKSLIIRSKPLQLDFLLVTGF